MVGMYSLSFEFTKSHIASTVSLLLFINLGGLGWIRLLDPRHGYGDWVHNWGRNRSEYWFHPLMHVLVPQRASLWSMPLCYWALLALVRAVESGDWRVFALAGIFVGFMPLVQIHSFVAVAQWSICFCLLKFPFPSLFRKEFDVVIGYIVKWGVFGIVANAMALPQFVPYANRLQTAPSQFLQRKPIWDIPERANLRFAPLRLWWNGLGTFWAMAMLGVFILTRRQLGIYVPSLIVYVITNFIRYQPWELDNTKLFYAAWIPVALPVVANFLRVLGRRPNPMLLVALALLGVSCASSFVHTLDCFRSHSAICSRNEARWGVWVAENLPVKAVVLASQWHAHPAATIAGRQLFMGYGGWVHSHGLDYWGRTQEHSALMAAPMEMAPFNKANIEYVVSRFREMPKFEAMGSGPWKKIYEDAIWKVWKKSL
jgi:hypothetical protein